MAQQMRQGLLKPWTYTILRWRGSWHVGLWLWWVLIVRGNLLVGLGTGEGWGISRASRVWWRGFIAGDWRWGKARLGLRWGCFIFNPNAGYSDILAGAGDV